MTYAFIGWAVVALVMLALWVIAGYVGRLLFKRLRRVYSLLVIGYWLDRFEREGLRTFERADDAADEA